MHKDNVWHQRECKNINILEVLRINPTIEHKILKRGIITDYLSQKSIKLRIGWLFSWRYKRLCNCSHMINSSDILTKWNKLTEWRSKWREKFKSFKLTLTHALLFLQRVKKNELEIKQITEAINEATEELTKKYFMI